MENFEDRLRRDAEHIRAVVSPELEDRIRASLESTTPLRPDTRPRRRSNWFWIASSLTGTAAALALEAKQEKARLLIAADGPFLLHL